MPKHESYSDIFTGKLDSRLRAIIGDTDESESRQKMKKILLNVIKNELTPRQKEIIMLYYFKNLDSIEIGKQLGITPQAVSAAMSRAKMRIFRIMKYYI